MKIFYWPKYGSSIQHKSKNRPVYCDEWIPREINIGVRRILQRWEFKSVDPGIFSQNGTESGANVKFMWIC